MRPCLVKVTTKTDAKKKKKKEKKKKRTEMGPFINLLVLTPVIQGASTRWIPSHQHKS